ncbi:MAG: hypothetical protein A2268_09960 [Candidatus Raymondbacteria bacterium RifOxyA12_full_50_37]|uniref:DNA mismatch repair protein MutL n=1 Tax=Candidatus Raymondbacteria bacterium RIFOXYD12_FULL_49_13 TaxID=1817890 RepID=A0A1F7F4A6_UNCRA|nr:MAG: hypothetical protein A2268_09960 [Candidatus Raymondbacteria bacterium RifOxyA12_full_50_37]OGJ93838.1 MAG: hypothetical protein A2248_06340 [Candidatus Raymondbacteria bacterium RIFOXYA2_FULL_49_16]OGJ97326.1 MAG: hypothetical protein A2487_16490 [Candidatus Raymondbacteria bacterium RifOxyC12_full_50_8]OGJ98295.1 MAG: hypothetical protein A2453_00835 [Candidatus Raymondbacteria bacterium RIFOXYC2_FULL_50_21]OGK01403.1 MAG: hypothetical protein A2519_14940 [Candidatus Raymondbacteria b
MENALDAGATRVVLELKAAGSESITVSDNGLGINKVDAELVFERYATSKIHTIDDLNNLETMGFRGEALSSIAAIAVVEVLTRVQEDATATFLRKRPGDALEIREASRTRGTTITVRDVFFNVPARKKFQKSGSAELTRIIALFSSLAVANSSVAFVLVTDGKERINLPAVQDPRERIGGVFGASLEKSLLYAEYNDEACSVKTYFSNLDVTRSNRSGQLFFINRRPIENRSFYQGVHLGYRDTLPAGRFPIAFVFITLNPVEIDVNAHPAKKEVRFSDESRIVRAISRSIMAGFQKTSVYHTWKTPSGNNAGTAPTVFPAARVAATLPDAPSLFSASGKGLGQNEASAMPVETVSAGPAPHKLLIPYFQLHDTYILCQIKNGLLIIDQHVAHERILYEKALRDLEHADEALAQQLLFPVTLDLSIEQKLLAHEYGDFFATMGFSMRFLSGNTLLVDGVPARLKDNPVKAMVLDILDELTKEVPDKHSLDKHFARSFACGAAIKAGTPLMLEEINALVDQLFQCENPYTCPHGRPVVVQIPLDEINRRFMRP